MDLVFKHSTEIVGLVVEIIITGQSLLAEEKGAGVVHGHGEAIGSGG